MGDTRVTASGGILLSRSAFYGSMAISIIGSLIVDTVLTLVLLLALYAVWFRVKPDEGKTSEG